jgi:transaldolase
VIFVKEESYLQWLVRKTPTRWWHDSANPDEIEAALKEGALGVTTNPVLTYKTLQAHPEYWQPQIKDLAETLSPVERAEALLKVVATSAARKLLPIYERTKGSHGYALGQLNPANAGDAEAMLKQARRIHSWAPNLSIKLPATRAGLEVIEEIASEGFAICATINISVAQAIAVAERYEKGARRAEKNGIQPGLCLVVQQIGRIDDYLRDIAKDMCAGIDESDIIQAGIAVAKRSYGIFKEKRYRSVIMPAGLRGAYHLTEMAGADVVYTLHPRLQEMLRQGVLPKEERINTPVERKVIDRLLKLPEFVRVYEPDGMKPQEFISYGLTQKILSQFLETGWALLETYGTNAPSVRWT